MKMRTTSLLFTFLLLSLTACQQDMSRQPYYRPLTPSQFFPDGRSARPLVPGTIPRGRPLPDAHLLTGRASNQPDLQRATAVIGAAGDAWAGVAALGATNRSDFEFVNTFPFEITRADLKRGQERFTIYCAVCHDPLGTGRGKIVERGYTQPPSYITDYSRGFERRGMKALLRDVPAGYFFEVMSQGYGAMPDYAAQVPPADRWRIAAYIRALQLSQYAALQNLPAEEQQKVRQKLEGKR